MTARNRSDVWRRDYGREEFPNPFDVTAYIREYYHNHANAEFFSQAEMNAASLYDSLEIKLRDLGFSYMADAKMAIVNMAQELQQWYEGMPPELFGCLQDPESGWEPAIFVPKVRMVLVRSDRGEKIYFRAQVKGDPNFVEHMVTCTSIFETYDPDKGGWRFRSLCLHALSEMTIMFFHRCRMYTDIRVLMIAPKDDF